MATLVLVRHGQASFGEAIYDRLSPIGEEQSRKLGAHWAKAGTRFDAIYTGPRKRQMHTAELALDAMRAAGPSVPDPVVLPELDEIGAEDVFQEHMPRLLAENPELGRILRTAGSSGMGSFNELLTRFADMWLRGEIRIPGLESWEAFAERVGRGFEMAREGGGQGSRIAVFTSGGTIGASLQRILGLAPSVSLNLARVVRNTSLTEVLFSGERLTLATFNTLPHLEDPALITYR